VTGLDPVVEARTRTAVYKLKVPRRAAGDPRPGGYPSPAAIAKFGKDYGSIRGTGPFIHEFAGHQHQVHAARILGPTSSAQLPYLDAINWRNVDQPAAQVAAPRRVS
jgi:hypothetical protein